MEADIAKNFRWNSGLINLFTIAKSVKYTCSHIGSTREPREAQLQVGVAIK